MIRLGAVGDVVRTLPAVSALRAAYPGSYITWLVEPASAAIVTGQPWVDRLLIFPRTELSRHLRRGRWLAFARGVRRFRRELRSEIFDLVLDFHSILKSGLLAQATRARLRVGYARPYGRELSWLFATERVRIAERRISRFDRNDALIRHLGVTSEAAPQPLRLRSGASGRVEPTLARLGARPIAIHPGTSEATPHKRWDAAGYGAVAKSLAKSDGVTSVVTSGPARAERAFAQAVVEASEGTACLAPETPTLGDLAALLSRCALYVGSDTGPMHVASLVGTPVVQILGPTDPVENAPWRGTPSRTVRRPVACSPCRRGCAAATCMRVVEPELVIEAARELLA